MEVVIGWKPIGADKFIRMAADALVMAVLMQLMHVICAPSVEGFQVIIQGDDQETYKLAILPPWSEDHFDRRAKLLPPTECSHCSVGSARPCTIVWAKRGHGNLPFFIAIEGTPSVFLSFPPPPSPPRLAIGVCVEHALRPTFFYISCHCHPLSSSIRGTVRRVVIPFQRSLFVG